MNSLEIFIYICLGYCAFSIVFFIVYFIYRGIKFFQCREKTICKEEKCLIRNFCYKSTLSDRERAEIRALIDSLPDELPSAEELAARQAWDDANWIGKLKLSWEEAKELIEEKRKNKKH